MIPVMIMTLVMKPMMKVMKIVWKFDNKENGLPSMLS